MESLLVIVVNDDNAGCCDSIDSSGILAWRFIILEIGLISLLYDNESNDKLLCE